MHHWGHETNEWDWGELLCSAVLLFVTYSKFNIQNMNSKYYFQNFQLNYSHMLQSTMENTAFYKKKKLSPRFSWTISSFSFNHDTVSLHHIIFIFKFISKLSKVPVFCFHFFELKDQTPALWFYIGDRSKRALRAKIQSSGIF